MHTQNTPWAGRSVVAGSNPKAQTINLIPILSISFSDFVKGKCFFLFSDEEIKKKNEAGKLIRPMTAI